MDHNAKDQVQIIGRLLLALIFLMIIASPAQAVLTDEARAAADYIVKAAWPDGAINMVALNDGGNAWIEPYSSNVAALGLVEACKDEPRYCEHAKNWFRWWAAHQITIAGDSRLLGGIYEGWNAGSNGELQPYMKNVIDSHVSVFLWALDEYYKDTGDLALVQELRASVKDGADWLLTLQDSDGLLWDGYYYNNATRTWSTQQKYIPDNLENYLGLTAAAHLAAAVGADGSAYEAAAAHVLQGIDTCYTADFGYRLAKTTGACWGTYSMSNCFAPFVIHDANKSLVNLAYASSKMLDPSGGVAMDVGPGSLYPTYSAICALGIYSAGGNIDQAERMFSFIDSMTDKTSGSAYYGGTLDFVAAPQWQRRVHTSGWYIMALAAKARSAAGTNDTHAIATHTDDAVDIVATGPARPITLYLANVSEASSHFTAEGQELQYSHGGPLGLRALVQLPAEGTLKVHIEPGAVAHNPFPQLSTPTPRPTLAPSALPTATHPTTSTAVPTASPLPLAAAGADSLLLIAIALGIVLLLVGGAFALRRKPQPKPAQVDVGAELARLNHERKLLMMKLMKRQIAKDSYDRLMSEIDRKMLDLESQQR